MLENNREARMGIKELKSLVDGFYEAIHTRPNQEI